MSSSEGFERLHKVIAAAGICSRRKAEELIKEGRVEVNGEMVLELGVKVGPKDRVVVDGRQITKAKLYYVLMNKPKGVVTTMSDPQGRPTIAKFTPEYGVPLKPVGRLDMETEGLLLLTNDGEFAAKMSHPRFGVEKEYEAWLQGSPSEQALQKLRDGVRIIVDERPFRTSPAQVRFVRADGRKNRTLIRLIIHEGKKRQIRLMGEAIGHPVIELKRIRIGHLTAKDLPSGGCRNLGKSDVDKLISAAGSVSAPKPTKRR